MPHRAPQRTPPGLGRFVHQLTHDLRNDLAAVEVFATVASGSDDPAMVREALAEISAAVASCGRRLAGLRAAACPEIPSPQMVQMHVGAWIEGICKHVERHPAAPFVRWRVEDGVEGAVCSDPALVASILDELLSNALRFSGDLLRSPLIQVDLSMLSPWVLLRVRQPIVEEAVVADLGSLDFKGLEVPALSATKHHYGFGLSVAALRAAAAGAELSAFVEFSGGEYPWFTATLKLPLTS